MARAATGTRFPGAAAAVMARLADYFIVVGYDHEKPGKGVGRAPPPGFASAPGSRPVGSAGPGVVAGRRGGGRAGSRGGGAAGRLASALAARPSLAAVGVCVGLSDSGRGARPRRCGRGLADWTGGEPARAPPRASMEAAGTRDRALVLVESGGREHTVRGS